jgi:adenylylsulfate kinase-like enzyme
MTKRSAKVFWITGLSGSGKTEIAKAIKPHIENKYGKTLLISGDNLREIFSLTKYDRKNREKYALAYSHFCKFISDQGINVIISTISLFDDVRLWNKKNIGKYIEIYIETKLDEIIKFNKKEKVYKNMKNIIGIHLKAELPKKSNIKIINNFSKTTNEISKDLIKLIIKKYK